MTTRTPRTSTKLVAASGVTIPRGFRAAGVGAGIKKSGLDLALLVSDQPATAAAVFTINLAPARS